MTQPTRTDPLATAVRVTGAAKDLATDLAEGFRKSDRPFKLRTAVVGTWLALAFVSIWVACPPATGPTNSLGATVRLDRTSVGPAITVINEGQEVWTEVAVRLDGGWRWEKATIRPAETNVIQISRFSQNGQPAPEDLRTAQVFLRCRQGEVVLPLGAPKP
jgi:hypothetical protein